MSGHPAMPLDAKLRKTPLWVPVLIGHQRLDLGLFKTKERALQRGAAFQQDRIPLGYGNPVVHARRVWVAVERP